MNDKDTKAFMRRLNNSFVFCDTKASQSTYDALLRAHQLYYSHSDSGNALAAREAWLNVRTLAYEIYNLYLGGVVRIYEGDL